MACLSPISIKNPRYLPSKVNNFDPPKCVDDRDLIIFVPCGKCLGCRRRKQTDWRFRMLNEFKYSDDRRFHFVTLTFSDESLKKLCDEFPDLDINGRVTIAVRRFLERYRKKYRKSLRHLLVTELGENTGRIHLHGIFVGCLCGSFSGSRFNVDIKAFQKIWSYGHVWFGWCSEASISYILKYIMKSTDDYKPLLLVSPGLGKKYCEKHQLFHHSTPDKVWYCVTSSGHKIAMPRYYVNHIFSDDDREYHKLMLWEVPPPLVFRGVTYHDQLLYERAVNSYYKRTLSVGSSRESGRDYSATSIKRREAMRRKYQSLSNYKGKI